jgi:hypothetical protein
MSTKKAAVAEYPQITKEKKTSPTKTKKANAVKKSTK